MILLVQTYKKGLLMKLTNYWRTVLLNLLFVLLLPVLLSVFTDSTLVFLVYLVSYSLIERKIDLYFSNSGSNNYLVYVCTAFFNLLIIFGISFIVALCFSLETYLTVTFLILMGWVLLASRLELILEERIEKKLRKGK